MELFGLWFQILPSYEQAEAREQKMTILAITALLQLPPGQLPAGIQAELPGILERIVWLCGVVSADDEEQAEESSKADFGGDEDDEEDAFAGDEELDDDEDVRKPRASCGLDLAALLGGEMDSEIDNKLPLDEIDVLGDFVGTMQSMQTSNAAMFNTLYGALSADSKSALQSVGNHLEAKKIAHA